MYVAQATRHSSSDTTERSECTAFPIAAVSGCITAVEPPTDASSPPVSAIAASVTVATLAASHAEMLESVIAPESASYLTHAVAFVGAPNTTHSEPSPSSPGTAQHDKALSFNLLHETLRIWARLWKYMSRSVHARHLGSHSQSWLHLFTPLDSHAVQLHAVETIPGSLERGFQETALQHYCFCIR